MMKQLFKHLMGGMLMMAMPLMFTSCEGTLDDIFGEWSRPTGNNNDNTKISVTSIELDKETLELAVGDADVTLTATVKPDDATDKTVTWSSDNEDAATVADGVVHAVAMGTATITAKAGDMSATCEVTVAPGLSTPLTLEVLTAGTIVIQNPKAGMQYSTDGGVTKNAVASGASVTINDGNDFNVGDKVEFYGDGTNITAYSNTVITTQIKGGTANFKVYGNIMSLVDETGFATATTLAATSTFYQFFEGSTQVIDASGLILPVTVYNCYSEMFKHCTNLTKAPKELPAETLAMFCYSGMFEGCSQLTTAPKLPAETLARQCYQGMFEGCSQLTTAPELNATTLKDACYSGMFKDCTNLTTAPELKATTLADECYAFMFYGCTKLASTPKLPAETLKDYCYYQMFKDCTSLTNAYVKAAYKAGGITKECDDMFDGCTATGAVLHTTSANSGNWGDVIPSQWTTWTVNDDWTD